MKVIIASDLHGSSYYLDRLIAVFNKENANKLILLGDIYNHGPRNPLPKDYNPIIVSEKLNAIKNHLIVIKGNCDSAVDTMISQFDFIEDMVLFENDKSVFLTHGHVYNKDNLPKTNFNAVIYGHFHTGFIEKQADMVIANPGSLSLPKNNTPNSYLVLENGTLTLKDLEGNVIKSVEL